MCGIIAVVNMQCGLNFTCLCSQSTSYARLPPGVWLSGLKPKGGGYGINVGSLQTTPSTLSVAEQLRPGGNNLLPVLCNTKLLQAAPGNFFFFFPINYTTYSLVVSRLAITEPSSTPFA